MSPTRSAVPRRRAAPWALLALCLAGPLGCPPPEEDGAPDAGAEGVDGTRWRRGDHPCAGGRTDALLVHESAWLVGCGTTAAGTGLWRSEDAGATWTSVAGFETWRVNDLDLEAGGAVVVAGTDTASRAGVARWREGAEPEVIWQRGDTVDESFQVGHYAALPDGRAIAESLTGGGLVFRDAADQPFRGISPFSADGQGYQILGLTTGAGGFWAVGSTISEPPLIFAPGPEGDLPLVPLRPLGDGVRGELWGVASVGERFVAVGVDQDADAPILLVAEEDPGEAASWRRVPLADLLPAPGWLRGACGRGDTLVVVGEKQPLSRGTGRVLRSTDGGLSWADISPPPGPESWSVCTFDGQGRLVVAGAGGGVARLD